MSIDMKEKCETGHYLPRSSGSRIGFLRRGWTELLSNSSRKVPEDNGRFIIYVTVGKTRNTLLRNLIKSDRLKVR
jgi:hypothetical protein